MTARTFKDHFSGHADDYAAHRPSYPEDLIRYLASLPAARDLAWDCATGNGQAARALAGHFRNVIATDASAEQVASAADATGVAFRVAPAEASGLDDRSVDLITVAQALHWFDIDAFFTEADRVLRPGGVLAAWSYERCTIGDELNELVEAVFERVEPFWPPERDLVDDGYRSIALPWAEIKTPTFEMTADWTAPDMLGYMQTWSAARRYFAEHRVEATAAIEASFVARWGPAARRVCWPLSVRVARKPGNG